MTQIVVDGKRTKVSRLLQLPLNDKDKDHPSSSSGKMNASSLVDATVAMMHSQRHAQPTAMVMADRTEHGVSDYSIMSDSDNKHTHELSRNAC